MARHKRRAKRLSDRASGILLTIVGLAIIAGLGGGLWWVKHSRPQLDQATNCPKSGPTGIHVILFDRSDPITDQQAQRIRQVIEKLKSEAPFGLRFDLYTFEGDTAHELDPKLRICAPGKPEDANQLIENPELVRRRYETHFAEVLNQTVSDLLRAQTQKTSPIIESLHAAAITSFGPVERGQIPLRITMISDMIQNTPLYSQFQSESNFQQLSRSNAWVSLQPQLKGAETDILYLLRPTAMRSRVRIQNRGHEAFWEQLIAASGGRLNSVDPL